MSEKPKLKLTGEDGNAFFILGRASKAAKAAGLNWEKIRAEATQGDYNHLLRTMMKHFEVK